MQQKARYILWAEDDEDDLLIMKDLMDSITDDFTVLVVHNGKEVLEHLKMKHPKDFPCLIILDINMPVLDGKMTLTQIKKDHAFREIPVVLFTTSNSKMDKAFSELHGVEMITKPSAYDQLKEVVQRFLSICS